VFDLWVVRLIAVVLALTSTKQFYFIHPLSSMRWSWYTHHHFLSRTSSRDLSISDLSVNKQRPTPCALHSKALDNSQFKM
jgi:hypothetical protein